MTTKSAKSAETPDLPHHGEVATGDQWLDLLGRLYLQASALDEGWAPPWDSGIDVGSSIAGAVRSLRSAIGNLPSPQGEQLQEALSEAAPEWV